MTREEEIIKQVEIYTDDASNLIEWGDGWEDYNDYEYVKKAFIKGAKWADETIIEKACEWLDINFPNIDNVGFWYKEGFIKQFKKAMEK